jgi:pimeloyl-ACP methyl ester carboxylesterase
LHVVEDCGHYVNLERPGPFRSLIDATIQQVLHYP